jgi:hypothetical protein
MPFFSDIDIWHGSLEKNIHQLHDLPKLHANVQILNQAPMYCSIYIPSVLQVKNNQLSDPMNHLHPNVPMI